MEGSTGVAAPPSGAQKRRRADSVHSDDSSHENDEDVATGEERSTDGEDDAGSLKDFVVADDEDVDDSSSTESDSDASEASTEDAEALLRLQQEAAAILQASPLQSQVINGRTLRNRAAVAKPVDAYWERFGKDEAARLEVSERKNEQLVELRLWVRDGLWTLVEPVTKRSTAEAVSAEHARACQALNIESSEEEDSEADEEDSEAEEEDSDAEEDEDDAEDMEED
jgi:hypothetical protein